MAPQSWLWQECNKTTILMLICAIQTHNHRFHSNFYLWFIRESNCLPIFNGFSLHLPCPIHSSFLISGANEKLLTCLSSIISQWFQSSPCSFTDWLLDQLSPLLCQNSCWSAFQSSFTNFYKCQWSLDVVFGGLPLRFAVWMFPWSRYFIKIVATVPLGLNLWNCCSSSFCHSHNESTLVFFNFLFLADFSTLDVLMIYLWLKMLSNAIARTKNLWDRHTSHK